MPASESTIAPFRSGGLGAPAPRAHTIVNFAEGSHPSKGNVGLIGVPLMAKSLADRGHRVVLYIGGGVIRSLEEFVIPHGAIKLKSAGTGAFGIVRHAAYGAWSFAPAMVAEARRTVRDADIVVLHSLYSFPVLLGYLLARIYRKPYVVWPHGVLAEAQRRVSVGRKAIYDRLVARRIIKRAAALIYSGPAERAEAVAVTAGRPSVLIPEGFDASPFRQPPERGEFRRRYLDGHAGPVVLFLSRLNQKKGLDLLARAFALVLRQRADVRLAIVGAPDPPRFEADVEQWLRESGVEGEARLIGFVADKRAAFADADVFVLPSETENFGYAIFEAMASGVPVVVADTLEVAAAVSRAKAGLVVPRTAEAMAQAMITLLSDSALRRACGDNGRRLAESFPWSACGERLESLVTSLVEARALP